MIRRLIPRRIRRHIRKHNLKLFFRGGDSPLFFMERGQQVFPGYFPKVALDEMDVVCLEVTFHGLEVDPHHHALRPHEFRRDLEPASGGAAAIEDMIARVENLLAFIDLDELVRGTRPIPIAFRLTKIMILDIAGHGIRVGFILWPGIRRTF